MDEILHQHDELVEPALHAMELATERPLTARERLLRAVAQTRDKAELLRRRAAGLFHRADAITDRPRFLAPLVFLLASAAIGTALVLTTVYAPGYTVTVDGVAVGSVADPQAYEAAAGRVEARASQILGYDYTLENEVVYDFALTEKDAFTPISTFENYLFDRVGEVMKTYVLKVNGQFVGAAADEGRLNAMLDAIKARYMTANTTEATFAEDVVITREYTPTSVEQNFAKMVSTLTANTNGETQYEVRSGDTFMKIATANDMTVAELQALNPAQDVNKLYVGQILTVRETIPFLSVKTVESQTYRESIPAPVEEVDDSTMFTGESKVLEVGSDGEAQITASVTYINGVEKGRDVVRNEVLTPAAAKVVAVGTKERPSWMPKGYFIWPTSGRITSSFGYRYIFGSYSYHSGIDIAVPYGSNVKAADGGTVVWSGTGAGSNWSYGNYVVIDHGNGKETYYAHNSSLLVRAGDKVYQGQNIAKAGSTGRSTGNHCHFQVKINGTTVNPLSYLP